MVFVQRRFKFSHIVALLFLINSHAVVYAQKAPDWVVDYKKVYPESEWICVFESASNKPQAQSAASSALAAVFKVDVKSLSTASQNFSRTVLNGENKISQNQDFGRQVSTTTDITGLMGVLTDFWTDPKGTVYASARMNKKDGTATYAAIIKENDKTIHSLISEADNNPASFDAYESLSVAADLATMTDNYLNILSVLNAQTRQSIKPSYGSAPAVEILAKNAARAIVITVDVSGDVNNRIAKAFGTVFSARGFRTRAGNNDNPYVLEADFQIEDMDLKTGGNSFARYEITAALLDADGVEIFSFSDNKRQGHVSMTEARQRALRGAEDAITNSGFAASFDEYLASLLK
jgi:hypothetical protein